MRKPISIPANALSAETSQPSDQRNTLWVEWKRPLRERNIRHSSPFFSPLVFDVDGLLSFVYPLNAQRSLLISILPTPSVHPLILSRLSRASSSSTTLLRGLSPLPKLFNLFIYLLITHLHVISKHRSVACR